MLTRVSGATESVRNALAPMTLPLPITVSPPKIVAFS